MIFAIDPTTNKKIIVATEGSIQQAIEKTPNAFLKDFFEQLNFNITICQQNLVSGHLNGVLFVMCQCDSKYVSIIIAGGKNKKQTSKQYEFKPTDNNKIDLLNTLTTDIRSMWSSITIKPTKTSNDISF